MNQIQRIAHYAELRSQRERTHILRECLIDTSCSPPIQRLDYTPTESGWSVVRALAWTALGAAMVIAAILLRAL